MITEEALKQYYQFEKDFEATCKHICELLTRLSKKYNRDWDTFEMPDEDSWQCVNCVYYVGDCDAYHEFFPTALLFMTDDEINEWIDKKLYEDLLEAERKKQIKAMKEQQDAEKKRERDLAEYERIKKEYNL